MKLTIPITKMFLDNRERLEPLVDALEFKGTTLKCVSQKAYLFHSHINFTYPHLQKTFYNDGIYEFLTNNNLNDFSFHIGLSDSTYPYIPIRHEPLTGHVLQSDEFFRIASDNIAFLRTRVNGIIAAENLDYIEGGAYENICDPHFISEFIHRFDLAFLLDIGHLQVAVRNLGYDPVEYIHALPLENTHEIHLHKPVLRDGTWRDLHHLPSEEEYKILELVLARPGVKPEYLNLECYEDVEGVMHHLKLLRTNFC